MTRQQYIEYLIATCSNYTCTNLSDHLAGGPGTSHDAISDFLHREKVTARGLWDLVAPMIDDGEGSYLILDDSVQKSNIQSISNSLSSNTAAPNTDWFAGSTS